MANGPLVLIDAMNTFLRNYVRSPYMDVNGERMGGTTGMIISIRKIINDFRASNCLVVWDGEGGSQKRKSIYSEYKSGRTVRLNRHDDDLEHDAVAALENFKRQIHASRDYLTMLGVPQVRADGVEADDLIAYVAGKMYHPHGCVIVSTDQDMLQLVSQSSPDRSEVKVYSPIKKVMYDHAKFISEYGVLPENFRLVKSLTGDSSDNIEGIKGFGVKTITKSFPFLLERYATADDVLISAGALKGIAGKRLLEEKSRFLENITLMDLSEPMLSASAARQARNALQADLGCREVDFRVRIIKDCVSFGGANFIGPFRDFVIRRRRLMKENEQASSVNEPESE